MIKLFPIISEKLRLKEVVSPDKENLENDLFLLESIANKLKDYETKSRVTFLIKEINDKLDKLNKNPDFYE